MKSMNILMVANELFFQCTTEYPSQPRSIGINNIQLLQNRYTDCVIGLSDHSGGDLSQFISICTGSTSI